jgi:thiamine pyrophosphate-dependent acetolactate synthase large subunit-like protein
MDARDGTEIKAGRLFGSDVVADALREQAIPYICINPGASYRGLHDSLVNHLGNSTPRIILCLHEEHAIAIAHGYAAVTNRPLATAVHSGVGLMHASMAIFNAWCGRVPMLILGATGPVDAARRRPWIDWIHTHADQGALVRDYTKWDDQPGSAEAAVESIRRGMILTRTRPSGPVYINLDATIQEEELESPPRLHALSRYALPGEPEPSAAEIEALVSALSDARRPVILSGRMSRSPAAWVERQRLAERLGAGVITDTKDAGSFSSSHPLFLGETTARLRPAIAQHLREADVILALDWVDLAGTLNQIDLPGSTDGPRILTVSNDFHIHRGWSMDYQGLPASEQHVATTPEAATRALLAALPEADRAPAFAPRQQAPTPELRGSGPISVADLAIAFRRATEGRSIGLMSRPIGWLLDANPIEHPLDFLGRAAGGGLGAGPGMLIGAALALRDMGQGRLPVAILGDGDYMMGINALWTATAEAIPLLIIIANNRSYYNDEEHQKHVARDRGRPEANAHVGQRLEGPALDLVGLARCQGFDGEGPVHDLADLPAALERGFAAVARGERYVIDVMVPPQYDNRSMSERR